MLDRAVVNAGPLVALSLAGRLDLLPALFREFWIPEIGSQFKVPPRFPPKLAYRRRDNHGA